MTDNNTQPGIQQPDDFKYIIQDINCIYFGKELKYEEMLEMEELSFKFKSIINEYVQKDTQLDKNMVEHLLEISEKSFMFKVFKQLKLKIRIYYKVQKKGFMGKISEKWEHKSCGIKEFCDSYRDKVRSEDVMIEDISISKLALMSFGV